VNFINCAD